MYSILVYALRDMYIYLDTLFEDNAPYEWISKHNRIYIFMPSLLTKAFMVKLKLTRNINKKYLVSD